MVASGAAAGRVGACVGAGGARDRGRRPGEAAPAMLDVMDVVQRPGLPGCMFLNTAVEIPNKHDLAPGGGGV